MSHDDLMKLFRIVLAFMEAANRHIDRLDSEIKKLKVGHEA